MTTKQGALTALVRTPRLGEVDAFALALTDESTLELGERAHDG